MRKRSGPMNHSLSRQKPRDQKGGSIDHEMSDELRQGPLAWTACTGSLLLVQSILDRGLNPNLTNLKRPGNVILHYAADGRQESTDGGEQGRNREAPTRCDTALWQIYFSTRRLLPTGLQSTCRGPLIMTMKEFAWLYSRELKMMK